MNSPSQGILRCGRRALLPPKLIYFPSWGFIFSGTVADVAELADALDSKSGIRKDVWVRPPPSAPWLAPSLLPCDYKIYCAMNSPRPSTEISDSNCHSQ